MLIWNPDIIKDLPSYAFADYSNEEAMEVSHKGYVFHKVDFVATISSLRLKPENLLHFKISLCRLMLMPMVRPTLASDLQKLE